MKTADLLEQHPKVWRKAAWHPFLDSVHEGDLPAGAFEAWLVQDYLFVTDLLVFQARLLAWSPRPAQAVLASGLVTVEAELEEAADAALVTGDEEERAEAAFLEIARLERDFWEMAWSGGSG